MSRVVTIFGTRPEIIRLSRIMPKLDVSGEHVMLHTGQNFDPKLSDIFFRELGVRAPDVALDVVATRPGEQIGLILQGVERVLSDMRPDAVVVLGDTNSGLSALIAKRMGIRVFHLEAGNRCFDDRVPEEVNRRVIDHASDVLMPYTERSRDNLLAEGIPARRILVTGNPIFEVMQHHAHDIARSDVHARLGLVPGGYLLATLHRAENVDDEARLRTFAAALEEVGARARRPVIVSTHPRTRSRMQAFGMGIVPSGGALRFLEPFGFFDFVALEKHAWCVASDSGTVQEECAILRVPNVTLRDTTERPETLECGSNILTGCDRARIVAAVELVTARAPAWSPPAGYLEPAVSDTVVRIVRGHHHASRPGAA